ncbi:hypothetical protein QFC19_001106 [Naganishia cerealis]|uniref:Uncharacterized protein n=1 Tax=Naganishia cerealis TaxID=610337 RepID=A0ACC2WJ42_9TREE|nr:hypothetical protein QFC19_001106 [Naganishia cerealis]
MDDINSILEQVNFTAKQKQTFLGLFREAKTDALFGTWIIEVGFDGILGIRKSGRKSKDSGLETTMDTLNVAGTPDGELEEPAMLPVEPHGQSVQNLDVNQISSSMKSSHLNTSLASRTLHISISSKNNSGSVKKFTKSERETTRQLWMKAAKDPIFSWWLRHSDLQNLTLAVTKGYYPDAHLPKARSSAIQMDIRDDAGIMKASSKAPSKAVKRRVCDNAGSSGKEKRPRIPSAGLAD